MPTISSENLKGIQEIVDGNNHYPHSVKLIDDPEAALQERIHLIAQSKSSVNMVYYKVTGGDAADLIFAELVEAAERGVTINMILDDKVGGYNGSNQANFELLASYDTVNLYGYNPINFLKPSSWNSVFHNKFINVDHTMTILGGRNIGDNYYNPQGYTGSITHDLDVLVKNDTYVNSLSESTQNVMDELITAPYVDQKTMGKPTDTARKRLKNIRQTYLDLNPHVYDVEQELPGTYTEVDHLQLVNQPFVNTVKEPIIGTLLQQLALNAQNRIVIQTPYATGNQHFLDAFQNAKERNVEVTYVSNSLYSSPNYPAYSNYHAHRKQLLEKNVHIYEYFNPNRASLHGKAYLFDSNTVVLGSFNLDDRSLYQNTESVVYIRSEAFNQVVQTSIEGKEDFLKTVDEKGTPTDPLVHQTLKVPLYKKCLMWIISLFSRSFQPLV